MPSETGRQLLRRNSSRPRCKGCGCWLTPICAGTDATCSNERCSQSWQAAKRDFESSLLGAACRQVFGIKEET